MRPEDFDFTVALPPGLTVAAIRGSIDYIERELPDPVEIYLEQANVFSSIVGIYGARALDRLSVYEKSRNLDTAQQRFPDLKRRGSGNSPPPEHCLESKGSKRPWALQAHYDHPGWYIVWRYLVDPTEGLERGHPVIIWRVDVVFLQKEDWKYEKSSVGSAGGGRTHTFGLIRASQRLRGCQVYSRSDVRLSHQKPIPYNGQ
ncbi:MAG: hypothetical protein Q8O40_11080 [Chloroflexota bacterium]|nr:hypothetical protein [Chloroflexota bacterium]